jgi:hypothetical protein
MTDDPTTPDPDARVIKDRTREVYVAGWSGVIAKPSGTSWTKDLRHCFYFAPDEARILHAHLLSQDPDRYIIVSYESESGLVAQQAAGAEKQVAIYHLLQGYYMSHTMEGKTCKTAWGRSPAQAVMLPYSKAQEFSRQSGIPALTFLSLDALREHVAQAPYSARGDVPIATRERVELIVGPYVMQGMRGEKEGDDPFDIVTKVNNALAKGARQAGQPFVIGREVAWPIVWVETAP